MREYYNSCTVDFWYSRDAKTLEPSSRTSNFDLVEVTVRGVFPGISLRFPSERLLDADKLIAMLDKAYDVGYRRMKQDLKDLLEIKERRD